MSAGSEGASPQKAFRPLAEQYRALRERRQAGQPVDFEALVRAFYTGLLRPGDIAFDLGAFKGSHTFPIAQAVSGPGAAVHAFEPNPEMAAALRQRLAAANAPPVTLHELAAADLDGESDFVLAVDSPGYSGLKQREYDQPNMRTQVIRVRMARLDTLFPDLTRLAYIKLDLEGGEFGALRGATRLIERLRPAITFEFGHRSYGAYGVDPGEVFDWFAARGYVLFDIIGNPLLARERFLRSDSIPGLWDYIAVPAEQGRLRRLARAQAQLVSI